MQITNLWWPEPLSLLAPKSLPRSRCAKTVSTSWGGHLYHAPCMQGLLRKFRKSEVDVLWKIVEEAQSRRKKLICQWVSYLILQPRVSHRKPSLPLRYVSQHPSLHLNRHSLFIWRNELAVCARLPSVFKLFYTLHPRFLWALVLMLVFVRSS